MADTINTRKLPYLPSTGYTPFQFQAWWQDVVDRLGSSVSSLNDVIAELIAGEERDAMAAARLAGLTSEIAAIKDAVAAAEAAAAIIEARLSALPVPGPDLMGMLAMESAARIAGQDAFRRREDGVELLAWLA